MHPSARNRARPQASDLESQRHDMIERLADDGLPEARAAALVDALCDAARDQIAQELAHQILPLRERHDAAWDWITRDSLSHQLRALVTALATVLGNPQDTTTAHGYVRSMVSAGGSRSRGAA
ncbi:hypothetical protein PYK79_45415 [Streptomyces sp. ID05-04B]|uniref:hypothetical protein n=1 Tax=Streptomyces sp. ID05-04B TaxID=3028661 RepID=UPI0029C48D10|nr:hypothetical protein [Streptomyces sp. ID05-04B]MDX5569070.1 hypothetical protein [Streptomyces sp. ID05-04B]